MSIRCNTCGNCIYGGTEFDSREEFVVVGKRCLGFRIFGFYFQCAKCSDRNQSAEFGLRCGVRGNEKFVCV
ncbi:hypothetical protein NL676_023420 [Syzygium grande]|nr:hypothetical protein NL676_023420 [Syzygium grande]